MPKQNGVPMLRERKKTRPLRLKEEPRREPANGRERLEFAEEEERDVRETLGQVKDLIAVMEHPEHIERLDGGRCRFIDVHDLDNQLPAARNR